MTQKLGHYEIIKELGRGGMGVVYLGRDTTLDRKVAIKVLSQPISDDDVMVQRFLREARSAAALNHPNIVQVYFVGKEQDKHYFVMEYVKGKTLADLIGENAIRDPDQAAQIILQAASGLAAAHDKGIFHRDIKPSNLIIDNKGLVKLADFGIAFREETGKKLTATGQFLGTPGYLCPEICLGEPFDARSDIFSLGIVFFEMLSGFSPFEADSPIAMMHKVVSSEVPDISSVNNLVKPELKAILTKMVNKKAVERYQNSHELLADLEQYLGVRRSQLGTNPYLLSEKTAKIHVKPTVPSGNAVPPVPEIPEPESAVDTLPAVDRTPPTLAVPPVDTVPNSEPVMPASAVQTPASPPPYRHVAAPKPSSSQSGVYVLLTVLLLFVGALGFLGWYFFVRETPGETLAEMEPLQEPPIIQQVSFKSKSSVLHSPEPVSVETGQSDENQTQAKPSSADLFESKANHKMEGTAQAEMEASNSTEPVSASLKSHAEDERISENKPAMVSHEVVSSSSKDAEKSQHEQVSELQDQPTRSTVHTQIPPGGSTPPSSEIRQPLPKNDNGPLGVLRDYYRQKTVHLPQEPRVLITVMGDELFAEPFADKLKEHYQRQGYQIVEDQELNSLMERSQDGLVSVGRFAADRQLDLVVLAKVEPLTELGIQYGSGWGSGGYRVNSVSRIKMEGFFPKEKRRTNNSWAKLVQYNVDTADSEAELTAEEAANSWITDTSEGLSADKKKILIGSSKGDLVSEIFLYYLERELQKKGFPVLNLEDLGLSLDLSEAEALTEKTKAEAIFTVETKYLDSEQIEAYGQSTTLDSFRLRMKWLDLVSSSKKKKSKTIRFSTMSMEGDLEAAVVELLPDFIRFINQK
ncbi:MAG: hypothetical protein CR997_10045 [Acidobacteria bacterium]|nr:MAG: hypothetical protein CR997_10045 [Acidobacteriota bacterium]